MKIKADPERPSTLRRARGFTLVELLLVLSILALLAAIVYPKLQQHMVDAHIKTTQVQIHALDTALEIFDVDNARFPSNRKGLGELLQRPQDAPNWHGPYIDSIPKDSWNHDYVYTFPGKHHPNGYDLVSAGPDGVMGTPDDIMNLQAAK